MSKEPSAPIAEIAAKLMSHIVQLEARCDALSTMVQILAMHLGAERKDVLAELERLRATLLQKRLETIEAQSPELAARIDQRLDAGAIDPDLLKRIRLTS